jgi:uncharacterized damage-inducible protein DinB
MEDLRYPIGKFDRSKMPATDEERRRLIDAVAKLPGELQSAVMGLSTRQIDTPYREGGWSVRQVVHHLADSHMNAYFRFKLALTEDNPPVRGFDEAAWAELADSQVTPIDVSLAIIQHLHARWVVLLRSLQAADWEKTVEHSQAGRMPLKQLLALYSWHGTHHVAHITGLCKRNGW